MEKVDANSLGFCPDNSPDKVVGVATNGLLVGSQDVAHDFDLLKLHGVTHVLNVGCGIPNAFEDVSMPTIVIPHLLQSPDRAMGEICLLCMGGIRAMNYYYFSTNKW